MVSLKQKEKWKNQNDIVWLLQYHTTPNPNPNRIKGHQAKHQHAYWKEKIIIIKNLKTRAGRGVYEEH